jgi:hypothetical protein
LRPDRPKATKGSLCVKYSYNLTVTAVLESNNYVASKIFQWDLNILIASSLIKVSFSG